MTNSLLLAVQCVAPVLFLIVIGVLLRHLHWINDTGAAQMDKLCFKLLLPIALFKNIYSSDFHTAFDLKHILIAVALTIFSFGFALGLSCLKEKNLPKRAALAQSIFRNNCVVFGLPIMTAMYTQTEIGMFSVILAFVIPLNNVLAVTLLSISTSHKIDLRQLVGSIVTNPFVVFCVTALLTKLIGITFPQFVVKTISDLAAASTPIALLSLGAGLHFRSVKTDLGNIAFGVTARLVLLPLICVPILVLLGIRGASLTIFYLVVGTPCAVASYIMAKQMGADGELAAHLVVFQSAFCSLTIFLALLVMSGLNLV